ncbi:MAG: glycoside hydrolase family 3 C-terminal domain-containing protein, partial [Mobilitalea sp.]
SRRPVNRVLGVKAGLDLEMPGCCGINDAKIVAAVKDKSLTEQELGLAACRVTELILEGMELKQDDFRYDIEAHHQLAIQAAEQSAVLLKNEDKLLPGNIKQKAAVIGAFAKTPRYQGAGSSKIHPIRVDSAWEALLTQGMELTYAQGYHLKNSVSRTKKEVQREEAFITEACEAAKGKDIVYLFAGLTEGYESEGFDRSNLSLPEQQNRLIEAVAACNSKVVVILQGGAPMELPWADKVKSILLAYLCGEGCGKAVANLLLGVKVPCGKLAESWPLTLLDTPAYHYYPGGRATVEYRESIFVGYRYYETAGKPVRYPFGHGLSYTGFTYSDLQIDKKVCDYEDIIKLTFQLTNHGTVAAKETALIFVGHKNNKVFLPEKELREFVKIALQPGESRKVTVELDTKTFAYYNTLIADWYAESGEYKILVGPSSSDCCLIGTVEIISPDKPQPDLKNIAPSYYQLANKELEITEQEFSALYGKKLPQSNNKSSRPYNAGNTLEDVSHTLLGKIIMMVAGRMAKKATKSSKEEEGMMSSMIKEMPFHSLMTSSNGAITERMLEGILDLFNGHYGKGIKKILRGK